MLGVALAFSVSLINASALSEFSQTVRSVNGQPDLEIRAVQGSFDEALYARVATDARVAVASPVLELATYALDASGKRLALRVVGIDALEVARVAPALMPVPVAGSSRFVLFAPDAVFLNAAASKRRICESPGTGFRSAAIVAIDGDIFLGQITCIHSCLAASDAKFGPDNDIVLFHVGRCLRF